jgi:hypothetical protein
MKIKLLFPSVMIITLFAQSIWANDPPAGGERLFHLGHPGFVTGALSASGGAIFSAGAVGAYETGINPALTAGVQRFSLDLAYTGLAGADDFGNAFYAGALFPSRYGTFSGGLQGAFLPLAGMDLGNMMLGRAGFARDVTDRLFVGADLYGGGLFGKDWALGIDAGFMYNTGTLLFLKDVRYSVVLRNMGKNFIDEEKNIYPGIFAPAAGIAAVFVDKETFTAGFSADVSFPLFQNLVFNAGLQFQIARFITASAGWDVNVREVVKLKGDGVHLPFIGIGVKFSTDMSKSGFMSKQGWQKTDFDLSGVWQQLNNKIQLFSVGITANFGMHDADPPVIQIEDAEEAE